MQRAKRSLEQPRAHESHEVRKKSKRNLEKHRTKVKVLGKDETCEENLERREIHRLDDADLHVRNQSISTAAYQEKQEANLKKSTHVIETKEPFNALNRIEDGVCDVLIRETVELKRRTVNLIKDINCKQKTKTVVYQPQNGTGNTRLNFKLHPLMIIRLFLCHFWTNFCQLVLVEASGKMRKWIKL